QRCPRVRNRIITQQVIVDSEKVTEAATGIDKCAIADGKVTAGAERHRCSLQPGGSPAWGWRRRRCRAGYGSKNIDASPPMDVVGWAGVTALRRSDMNSRVV